MSATSPATAASAVSIPPAISTPSTSCAMPSPTRVISTSPSSIASLAVQASTSTSAPDIVPPHLEVKEAAASSVVDEVCPDSDYSRDDLEEFVTVHATAEFENSLLQNLAESCQ